MQNYCISYASSGDFLLLYKSLVYCETSHAIFAQQIQNDLALLTINYRKIFQNVNKAFNILKYSLRNPNSINLALIITVICNLER